MFSTKEEKNRQLFESISERYDLVNSLISFFLHNSWRKDLIKTLKPKKGTRVIDLCCGTGELTLSMAQEISPGGEVYGLDFSEKMLEKAKIKQIKSHVDNVTFLCGNVRDLPFEDESFHYATICFGLRNVSNYADALKEVRRVLKPGGILACLETSRPSIPVFKELYYLYMRYAVPYLGGLLTGNAAGYLWLQESTWAFPDYKALMAIFKEAGFENIFTKPYLGGVTAMHLVTKPQKKATIPLFSGKGDEVACKKRKDNEQAENR
ncbi:MAG: demethylmenaquinone methyltransferase [Firmicutes bacterium]|nr:demethylmenaquinone methyltransferase [Bacillota bacterium]